MEVTRFQLQIPRNERMASCLARHLHRRFTETLSRAPIRAFPDTNVRGFDRLLVAIADRMARCEGIDGEGYV